MVIGNRFTADAEGERGEQKRRRRRERRGNRRGEGKRVKVRGGGVQV